MPYSISASRFSFVQFAESDTIQACGWTDTDMCLPVYLESDVWFPFVITADTEEEADVLCSLTDEPVAVGLVEQCSDGFLLEFTEKPIRNRISTTQVSYWWQHGFPGFTGVLEVGDCFHVKIEVADQSFCSNCFQRIGNDCHTSVLEYSNNDNAFEFNYCASTTDEQGGETEDCEPTILQFTNQSIMTIPWTAYLQAKYGSAPTVQVWIYDENGELVAAGLRVALDTYPPTELRLDFGGNASGIIKIF